MLTFSKATGLLNHYADCSFRISLSVNRRNSRMPRVKRFTERHVAALKAGKRTHVSDTPNLYAIKIANGVNRYFYRYTRPGLTIR